jgi:transcriptional regulator with XRE-family HTH domain
MKEINLASVIAAKRREKGITQEELAEHIGVSKASVSKWETGQSYPDITLLPQLAAYFDMSIDCLVGYTPQMDEDDINKLYRRLASDFSEKPFEDVVAECGIITKRYYSCYPLLLKISLLYINHASLTPDRERGEQILMATVQLCERVKMNSNNARLIRNAVSYQAMCYLFLGNGEAALELLGESPRLDMQDGMLIAQAFQILGNVDKAQEILQIDLYQSLMATFHSLMVILQNNLNDLDIAEAVYLRAEGLAKLFNMHRLSPNTTAMLYTLGAQIYQMGGSPEKAIELLSRYVDICIHGFFPVELRGDDFFDKINGWLIKNSDVVPKSETTIKESLMNDVLQSPVFDPLREYPEYGLMIQKLKSGLN